MKKILLPFAAFFFLFSSLVLAKEKIAVAVLDFEAKNISQESADAVTDLLRTELFNTGRFQVLERQKIQKIIEEQKFQMSGLTDVDQVVEIGRLLNVKKIIIGTVTLLGNTHLINTRLVDVQSGLVILAESVESRGGEESLPSAIAELALKVAYKIGLEGTVIRISPDAVFIDLGSVDGVSLGQTFNIIRSGEVITDLEGRVIGTNDEVIGSIVITKLQDRFSGASIVEKTVPLRKGDKVKPVEEGEKITKVKVEKKKEKQKEKEKVQEGNSPEVPLIF